MILDTLHNADRYLSLHPLFEEAFRFLRESNPTALKPGTYEIRGKDLYAIVTRQESAAPSAVKLEAHRRYIDIQVALEGEFPLGWRPVGDCHNVATPYSEEKDVAFYSDPVECIFAVKSAQFVILFPEDAHAPGLPPGPLVKVVLKIAVKPGTEEHKRSPKIPSWKGPKGQKGPKGPKRAKRQRREKRR